MARSSRKQHQPAPSVNEFEVINLPNDDLFGSIAKLLELPAANTKRKIRSKAIKPDERPPHQERQSINEMSDDEVGALITRYADGKSAELRKMAMVVVNFVLGELRAGNFEALKALADKNSLNKIDASIFSASVELDHPGKIIERYLVEHDWSVIYAAERLGMTRMNVYRVINGETNITPTTARALERSEIGGSALDWLVLQAKFDLAQPERPPTKKRRVGRTPKA